MQKVYPANVWMNEILFYLDGASFPYKVNSAGQARAPRGWVWGQKCEGLERSCTAKGQKVDQEGD